MLCAGVEGWDTTLIDDLIARDTEALAVLYLGPDDCPGVLFDATADALSRLGILDGQSGQYLVRPDGYIGFRCAELRLDDVAKYLRRWLVSCPMRRS